MLQELTFSKKMRNINGFGHLHASQFVTMYALRGAPRLVYSGLKTKIKGILKLFHVQSLQKSYVAGRNVV